MDKIDEQLPKHTVGGLLAVSFMRKRNKICFLQIEIKVKKRDDLLTSFENKGNG